MTDQIENKDRRAFLGTTALTAGAVAAGATLALSSDEVGAAIDPTRGEINKRRRDARAVRIEAAQQQFQVADPGHPFNDDETRYSDRRGSYSKALPHDANGFVDPSAYNEFLNAVDLGTQAAFENVPLGGDRVLVNPLNAYAFNLIGADSHNRTMAPAPTWSSLSTALDMVERYWMALARDVPFAEWNDNEVVNAACADLNSLGWASEFGFECTPQTLFRVPYNGGFEGGFVSQFLLQPVFIGNTLIDQNCRHAIPGVDYVTGFEEYVNVQRGTLNPRVTPDIFVDGGNTRFGIATPRNATDTVHFDLPHTTPLFAVANLIGTINDPVKNGGTNPEFFSAANPYRSNITTSLPFGSWGFGDIVSQVLLSSDLALRYSWFQKWCVHRRARPEVFAQRVELVRRGFWTVEESDINPVLFESAVLPRIFDYNALQNSLPGRTNEGGNFLLPIAFAEGSPTHPAYPGGHSTFVAVAATLCKAHFDQNAILPRPYYSVTADGQIVVDESIPDLTIEGELNKLTSNITHFRDIAGMHWRTDGALSGAQGLNLNTGGNMLGETLAIDMLRDFQLGYREIQPEPFRFTSFNGQTVTIGLDGTVTYS